MLSLPALPSPGAVVADRFVLQSPAGRGGMGSVFRAWDKLREQAVALKLLHATNSSESLRRFEREARVLAELRHPGIVTYVAHGVADGYQPFLAMEWLEGESLERRLARQPLDTAETLLLLRRLTEALVAAHQRGIIHRDIKPSNLFLRSGRVEEVVLLDFGLARHAMPSRALTRDATVLGTPGYMAPEQAASQGEFTFSTDIFALGCVLYECLTGRPPFKAPTLAAVLAKILFTEPPALSTLRKDLPASWQGLLNGMLAKEPAQRLADARSLRAALAVLEAAGADGAPPLSYEEARSTGLSGLEQQLVSILLAAPAVSVTEAPTLSMARETPQVAALLHALRAELTGPGVRVELLVDGSLLATLQPERGAVTDQAARAARSALWLKARWPEARVVLTTGRGLLDGRGLVGEAMDRAGELQHWLAEGPASHAACVVLDELTAGLLGPGFVLEPARPGALLLQGEQLGADETRSLLGKPTLCVGRERELALLEVTFATCVEEPFARALLVTAPAGMGKSRLRHEFLRRLERQGQETLVLLGRGELVGAKASECLLGQALRRLCGIQEGEPLEVRREKLAHRLSRHLGAEQVPLVLEFLGELCGLSPAEDLSPRLLAAREDPKVMGAQLSRALVTWLRAECAHSPVLLVLEDLHWGDALTVRLVDEVLRELAESPLLVLALARPEVKELFPGLWSRGLTELPLSALGQKAGVRLVREVLGADAPQSVVDRIVEQAAGNALFLEELLRAQGQGRGESPPGTVLAMLQARILQLEPEARQVLLAGSFFGRTFWSGGVRALLGEGSAAQGLERWLRLLVEGELLVPQDSRCFAAQEEYAFRHALVREAAYGLVPESHKPQGHWQAAQWLEQAGESDARVLAEHYHLGQQPERAAALYVQAAEQLLERGDLAETTRLISLAQSGGARGEVLTRLRVLRTLTALWLNDMVATYELGSSVLPELAVGSKAWCRVMGHLLSSSIMLGRQQEVARWSQQLLSATPAEDAVTPYVETLTFLCWMTGFGSARQEAYRILERIIEAGSGAATQQPVVRGWVSLSRSNVGYFFDSRLWQALDQTLQARQAFLEAGAERQLLSALLLEGLIRGGLGDIEGALERLRSLLQAAREASQPLYVSGARLSLAQVLARHAKEDTWRQEAQALTREEMATTENPVILADAHLVLALVASGRGELSEAVALARRARELADAFPTHRVISSASLSRLLLRQGAVAGAREQAESAVQVLERIGSPERLAILSYVALADVCLAQGEARAGEAALRRALECLHAQAQDITEPAARERFLRRVPENARTLELARQRQLPWPDGTPV